MGISVESFHKRLLEEVLDIIWSQWTAVGAYTSVSPYQTAVIDSEALVCATMWFGRYSPRLFDEAMDWLSVNDALISIDRLKSIAGSFSSDTRASLGAVLDYLWKVEGRAKFRGKSSRLAVDMLKTKEALFRSWPGEGEPFNGKGDDIFLKWGFERSRVELRGMSSSPSPDKAVNLRFVLRDLFGIGVRAEVATYLVLVGRGNSSQIAKSVNQNQRAVYSVLDDFASGGFADRREAGRETVFSIDTERWSGFVDLGEQTRFIQWTNSFSALQELLCDRVENERAYGSPYLASSRFREISPGIIRKLSDAGVKTSPPDSRRYPGEDYSEAFIDYVGTTIKELVGNNDSK
ncbi:MAG: hypothetical protein KKB90_10335 [Actinobacteria bacterium]|nr:hypothetical protein [Actinomycetota bacterium]MCG2819464.1 hypothetical protein [Actinomycetes bacterium]MBU4219344.1 hypothetical protein [Actinomycetota bacterium]MBU4357880.1 hypothetical protein [Actinomycetota bacterium]MBU4391051.1 hypothetical protein [Actinomycetota bacterium]